MLDGSGEIGCCRGCGTLTLLPSCSFGQFECSEGVGTLKLTWMFVLECSQVVYILVYDDVQVLGFVVGGHVGGRECLGHGAD